MVRAMTGRADFTDDQWFLLRAGPWQVARGVVEADPSGALNTEREYHKVDQLLRRALTDDDSSTLVRLVAEDLVEGGDPGVWPAAGKPTDATGPDRVIEAMTELRSLLAATVDEAEAGAFAGWLVTVAEAVAEAAKEGTAGLKGPRVSEAEAEFVARLRDTLGAP